MVKRRLYAHHGGTAPIQAYGALLNPCIPISSGHTPMSWMSYYSHFCHLVALFPII